MSSRVQSPLRRTPEREAVFGILCLLWVGFAVVIGIRFDLAVAVFVLLVVGYFTLRLIHAVERLAAATERLARESDELSDSVNRWPWP